MKGSDKAVVMGVIVAVVLAGFYFKALSPKREKASSLSKDITELQAQVDEQRQLAQFGEDARQHFPSYYGRMVVLGKAVPSNADTPSLLVQLNTLARRTSVNFNGLTLSASSGGTATPSGSASPSTATTPSSGSSSTASGSGSTSTSPSDPSSASAGTTTPTVATEATAANLPLGATVGAAGLPVMPYDLTFSGSYFDVADFLTGIDDLVRSGDATRVAADGRLLTVNGFSLELSDVEGAGASSPNPQLQVSLSVTSYLTPSDQGTTVDASPSGPGASLAQPETQPTSATVSP